MTTTVADPVFVDTNVLVYALVVTAPLHAEARAKLDELRRAGVELWISRQVLREYMATVTRTHTWMSPSPPAAVTADVGQLLSGFRVAEDGPAVTTELLALFAALTIQGRQVHDANIVATMLAHAVPNLLTHNAADFARYAGRIAVVQLVPPSPTGAASPTPGAP